MGRNRKNGNPLGLETRVYWHRGQWQYKHRDGSWEKLGTDVDRANERARLHNDQQGHYGTIGYYIDLYIKDAETGNLPAGRKKRPRTIADNKVEAEYLKAVFGKHYPHDIARQPNLLSEYRDRRVSPQGRGKTRANRELSLLSATYAWLIERGFCSGLTVNPVRLVKRFAEKPKERYVEDHEFHAVYAISQRSVCMAMTLAYKTLQRPSDVLAISPHSIRSKTVSGIAKRVLTVKQSKTGRQVDIEITPDLDTALAMQSVSRIGAIPITESVSKLVTVLVHDLSGQPYTETGIGAMLRRYCNKAGVKSFGLMDVRAKGATDMYLAGVPIEHIQMLMGHASVQTTEIYIKRMLATVRIAQPNAQQMVR